MASILSKATVKIKDFQSERTINLEDETTYICRTSYGIIVIEDTLRKAEGTVVGTYLDGALTLVSIDGLIDLEVGIMDKAVELRATKLFLKVGLSDMKMPMVTVFHPG